MSRDLNLLHPTLKSKIQPFIDGCKARGIDVGISCTGRMFKEQVALFAQGRQPLEEVNALRKLVGWVGITVKENTKKVTWTMLSRHIVNLDDNKKENDLSTAFDFYVIKNGKAIWDVKVSLDDDDIPDYRECGEVAKELGLEAGAFWSTPDFPHIQLYEKDIKKITDGEATEGYVHQ